MAYLAFIPVQSHHHTQTPQRTAMRIFRTFFFQPTTFIRHKIAKQADVTIECMVDKTQVDGSKTIQRGIPGLKVLCGNSNNQCACIIVHAITMFPIRYGEFGVLQHTHSIRHTDQMVKLNFRQRLLAQPKRTQIAYRHRFS